MLDATAGSVDPTIGFPTAPIGFATDDNRLDLGGLDDANNANTTTPTRESGLTLTATPSITEAGGVIIYTATLGQPPLTDLTVTLSNGQVIVISAGQTTGSVSVTIAPNDTVYVDGSEISATITGTSGGAGLIITPDTTPAVTQITDTVDTTTVTLSANPSITEGGVITYTATLTNPAQTPVTVTLSNGTTITIGAGQTSGTVDVQTPANDVYNNGSSVSTTITGATGGNFESLVPDPNPAVTTITDSLDNTGLSLTATGTVAEGGQIIYTATLTNPAGTPVTVTLSNGAVITIAAGQTEGSVSVAAPGDDVYIDAGSVGVTIDKADGGNFENLVVSEVPAVTEVTDTINTSTVTLTATPSVAEGGVVTYTASVTAPVTGSALVINLANGQQITIPVGQSSGSVEFVAPDNVHTTNPDLTNSITGTTGGNFEKLETTGNPVTTVTDGPDTEASTGLSLTATGNVEEGGQITYTATLTNPAGTAMTVTLSNGAVIEIKAGETSGTVTVDAPTDDVYLDAGKVEATIESTDGGDFENLVVDTTPAVTDVADTYDTSTVKLTADVTTIGEGGVITYTATVSSPVTGTPLVITLANGQSITIPVNATSGTVQYTAPDNVHTSNLDLSNSITGTTGGNFEKLETSGETTITVTDSPATQNDTGLKLTATTSVDEGGKITYTATLTNKAGTDMTVSLDNGKTITIKAGETTGTVTIDAPGDDVYLDEGNVGAKITGTNGGDFESLVVDGSTAVTKVTDTIDTTTLKLTATPSVDEGGKITYTATLSNPAGTPVTVTLSNGKTIIIAADKTSGSITIDAPSDDVYIDAGDVSATITGANGGNFEKLEISDKPAVTHVADTTNTTTVGITGTTSVAEGESANYTLTLSSKAETDVTITLRYTGTAKDGSDFTGVATVTIPKGSNTGTFSVPILRDGIAEGAESFNVQISSATGGNFENLVVGDNGSVTTTIVSNEAPVAAGGAVTGTEDTDLVLTWANFGITDADTPAANLGLTITKLPADGVLQYKDGDVWKTLTKADVDAAKTFSKADIDAGKLKFVPDHNESGINANGGNGVGDQKADYAQIQFKPTDGQGMGNESTLKVDITPVADAPSLIIGSNNVNSIGLVKETWNSLKGLGTNGNGITGDALKTVFDNAGNPNSSSTVTNAQSNGSVTGGSGSKTSGLIFLEAGKTYSFSGVGDDSLLITIGGKNVASATWGAGGGISGSFTPSISGYYTLDIYHANQSGPGSYDVNLSVNGGTPVDLSNSNIPMYPNANELSNAGVTVGELHGDNGEGYYQGYKLNEGAENGTVKLVGISTGLTDTDGSEKLSIKLGGIPEGSILSDGAGHTVTVGKTEVDVTGWNLNGLSIKPPAYYHGQFDVTVTSTATEKANNDTASTPGTITVTVYPDTYLPGNLTAENDNKTLGTENDIVVADVNGLHVVPGQDYNLAFIVDTSGSMEKSGVDAARKSLESVFKTLANSVNGAQSGTVNILLVDFSEKVNTTVSIDLADKDALKTLQKALDNLKAGGSTNYEDAFKTTANWFQNLKDAGSTGSNQTFFITDGEPNVYQRGEKTNPTFAYSNYTMDDALRDLKYKSGDVIRDYKVGDDNRISIDKSGYLTAEYRSGKYWYTDYNASGKLNAQGDGTFELSYAESGSYWAGVNAKEAFLLLANLSSVEAIGLNNGVNANALRPYDTDGKPQTNIDPSKLAEAILGHTEATKPGNDALAGGDGNDILFGDLVSFDGIAGNGVEAMQAYVAGKLGVNLGDVDGRVLHQYITEHVSEFDVSRANDGADTLLGGDGNDILFGQGGDDYLDGGKGNDILLGGNGSDTLLGEEGNDLLFGGEGKDFLTGGKGDDILTGGSGADTFIWKAGDTGKDVIKDFKPAEGDRLDLSDLLQGEKASTIDNFLKITTVNGESTLQVSSEGKLNSAGGLANADVTIKLEGVNWANTTINSLVTGADPTIKIDHSNS
ncbi:type I secretion C-terminal target domain-containing protein [Pseudomonas alkylphenolica]|uniref:Type I secretion C-terminal target domain-containing protein n=2 Tax=Pseudomonas alkylphenolica TaxID=237609 RepID=A0A6I6GZ97_9PSED|nr:type I secretion C-terminal target domain-containing protein [Pseudomonas alkylphenolica]